MNYPFSLLALLIIAVIQTQASPIHTGPRLISRITPRITHHLTTLSGFRPVPIASPNLISTLTVPRQMTLETIELTPVFRKKPWSPQGEEYWQRAAQNRKFGLTPNGVEFVPNVRELLHQYKTTWKDRLAMLLHKSD